MISFAKMAATILVPLAIRGCQLFYWLRIGRWLSKALVDPIWNVPHTDWGAIQRILESIFAQNAELAALALGLVGYLLAGTLLKRMIDDDERMWNRIDALEGNYSRVDVRHNQDNAAPISFRLSQKRQQCPWYSGECCSGAQTSLN